MKLTSEQKRELERLIKSGNKIEAVKQLRNMMDLGLAEALAAINAMEAGVAGSSAHHANPKALKEAEAAALAAIRDGNIMEAIKRYQLHTRIGLKESKDAVDALSVVHRTDGRIDAKLARKLISLVAAGQKQEAITQLMSNKGYDEAEAQTFIATLGKLKLGGASCASGCLRMILVAGILIAMGIALSQGGLDLLKKKLW